MVTVQNYHVGRKPNRDSWDDLCSPWRELCTRSFFRQGQPSVFRDTFQTKTSRDREAPLTKGEMQADTVLKKVLKVLCLDQQTSVRESNTGPGFSI